MKEVNIQKLLEEGKASKASEMLYRYFPVVRKHVQKNQGTRQAAEDIFQEALIVIFKTARQGDLVFSSAPETYIFSVCRYLWLQELKKRKGQVFSNEEQGDDNNVAELVEQERESRLAETAIRKLGEACRKLLSMFY